MNEKANTSSATRFGYFWKAQKFGIFMLVLIALFKAKNAVATFGAFFKKVGLLLFSDPGTL